MKSYIKKQVRILDEALRSRLNRVNSYTPAGLDLDDGIHIDELLTKAHDHDLQSFQAYNKASKNHPLLGSYKASRSLAKTAIMKRRARFQRKAAKS